MSLRIHKMFRSMGNRECCWSKVKCQCFRDLYFAGHESHLRFESMPKLLGHNLVIELTKTSQAAALKWMSWSFEPSKQNFHQRLNHREFLLTLQAHIKKNPISFVIFAMSWFSTVVERKIFSGTRKWVFCRCILVDGIGDWWSLKRRREVMRWDSRLLSFINGGTFNWFLMEFLSILVRWIWIGDSRRLRMTQTFSSVSQPECWG